MGTNLDPILRLEIENLGKDPDNDSASPRVLHSYVKELDSSTLPVFLAHITEQTEPMSSQVYKISLLEDLARVHGWKISLHINKIMSTIISTLSCDDGSFSVHEACSKVVCVIAHYCIDPLMTDDVKKRIIGSLCMPLSDCLISTRQNIASGCALCLKDLVGSHNWRFASHDLVDNVCLKVAGALEEQSSQMNFGKCRLIMFHLELAVALSKHDPLIVEPYARSLIKSGLQILNNGVKDSSSEERFLGIQLIHALMKVVDSRGISSEIGKIVNTMEECQGDHIPSIKSAAFEALEIAKIIGNCLGPSTGLSSNGRQHKKELLSCSDVGVRASGSPQSASAESLSVHSFLGYKTLRNGPSPIQHCSCTFNCLEQANDHELNHPGNEWLADLPSGYLEALSGVAKPYVTCLATEDMTQKSWLLNTVNDVKTNSTPRKHLSVCQCSTDISCKELGRDGCRVPLSPTVCHIQCYLASPQSWDVQSWDSAGEAKERSLESSRQMIDQLGVQSSNHSKEGTIPSNGSAHDDSARKSLCGACNKEMSKPSRCRPANVNFMFGLCAILVGIILSYWWVDNGKELFSVPT